MRDDTPSATAQLIARSIVFADGDPRIHPLLPAHAAEASAWFLEANRSHRLLKLMRRPWFRWLVRVTERAALPGIFLHYVLRKRWIEDVVRFSVLEGFTQVVILGAGFDTLALRLQEEYPAVRFFEADHPATQAVKRHALELRNLVRSNLTLLPVDMTRETLTERLQTDPDFWPDADTVFVAEGVLMYLSADEVTGTFRAIANHKAPRVKFAFTYMQKEGFPDASRVVDWWLRARKEQFRWGLDDAQLEPFLQDVGFTVSEQSDDESLREQYLNAEYSNTPLARGEKLCVATRSSR